MAVASGFGDAGADVPPDAVWIPFRRSINDVVPFRELCQQPRDLLRRLLQVVVHRDDDVVAARTNAAQECVVLTVVAHQVDALISGWRPQRFDRRPAGVAAAVVDQDDFVGRAGCADDRNQAVDQRGKRGGAVVYGNDDCERLGAPRSTVTRHRHSASASARSPPRPAGSRATRDRPAAVRDMPRESRGA